MNPIVIMLMIHNELKIRDIFQEVINAIQSQTIACDVWVFGDLETPKEQWDMIPKEWRCETSPLEIITNIPLKHKYAYDRLVEEGYPYIMINQADDTPHEERAKKQLKALKQYAMCGVCLCGYELYRDGKKEKDDFFKVWSCGFTVGYPSCWMLSTIHVPVFPELVGFERPYDVEWDPYILLKIQQTTPILILEDPLEIYRLYEGNLSSQIPKDIAPIRMTMLSNYYAYMKPKLHDLITIPRGNAYGHQMTIMVISRFKLEQYGYGLTKMMERYGYKIIRVATDWQVKPEILDPKIDIILWTHPKFSKYRDLKGYIPIAELVKMYPQTDMVFFSQSPVFVFDLRGLNVPLIYYHQDIICPRFPINAQGKITHFFYAYYGAYDQMKLYYPVEMNEIKTPPVFMPYGAESSLFPPTSNDAERDIFLGFKGTVDWTWLKDKSPFSTEFTPVYREIYANRKKFLEYAQENCGLVLETRNNGSENEYNDWLVFMKRCVIGINIPGKWGWVNERQFIIPLCGCVLLQWRYPQLTEEGFIDFQNCLLFSSEYELYQKIEWAKHHPTELIEIRNAGERLVRNRHTFRERYNVLQKCLIESLKAHPCNIPIIHRIMAMTEKQRQQTLVKQAKAKLSEDQDHKLWKEWRRMECPKTPHKKFKDWVKERKK